MKKNYLLAVALAIMTMASCSDDNYVGDQEALNSSGNGAIAFNMSTPAVTRAPKTGSDAATLLANNFVVFGYKTVSASEQTVFDNYQVNYVANTANKTESNSANWEYVGYKNLPFGTTTTSGGTLNTDGVAKNASGSSTNVEQSIKYWDFSASKYDFFAYSLGTGEPDDEDADSDPQYAKASQLSNSTYTLEGNATQLGACYISNKNTLTSLSTSTTEVDLEFRSFLSKVQLGFYEIIPGYSVKEVKFYPSAVGDASTTPSLYAASAVLPNGGKYTITFDSEGKPQLALAASDPTPTTISKIDFSSTLTNYAAADYKEASASYLGRASNAATLTDIINVLPNPTNTNALNLKMDFTLVSRDGTGETINMTGATAVIPAAYAQWKPNYKYTYLFKISDNTDAQSGSITGLYPITLDAIVADAQDGSQETITTVSNPSITTYANGEMVTANDEYLTGANIYVVVDNGTTLTVGTNAKLYTATVQDGAAQGITEETVKNALANGTEEPTGTWTVTDALGKNLVVTNAAGLSAITSIDANDAPDGHAITVNGAKFTPAEPTFTVVASGTSVTAGDEYYTAADGSTKATVAADGTASENQYWTKTATAAGYYVFEYIDGSSNKHYKVIKVVDKY